MKSYNRMAWLVVGLWLVFCLFTLNYNGPIFDEGIYITAGQRTLEGHAVTDGYLGWFGGSLLWPMFAALGYKVAGLIGTRLVALALATIALVATVQAAKNLFGLRAGFWTATMLAISAPFMALARLGVYDVPALAGVAVAFWAVTELHRRDNRVWLAVAIGAFIVAMFFKYPIGLMLLPILGVLFFLRQTKFITDAGIFGFVSLAITLAFVLPMREQFDYLIGWQLANKPTFGVTPLMVGYSVLYWTGAPFLLAAGGWQDARQDAGDRRGLASVMLLSLIIWPAYHLLSGNPTSLYKHLVIGSVFAYPLAGLALSALWENGKHRVAARSFAVAIVLALTAFGLVQLDQFNRAWPDARPAANYLVGHVRPGQQLLINESWPYTLYLYTTGRIHSPWDVFDAYRVAHGQSTLSLCAYDWFVDSQGSYEWPESVLETIKQCGSFQSVFSTTSTVIGLGKELSFVSCPVQVTVWQNTFER